MGGASDGFIGVKSPAIHGRIAACQTTGKCQLIDGNAIQVAMMIVRHDHNQTEVASPAKVNLFLELLGKRPDGFHEIETVMSSVSIYDRLRFTRRQDSQLRIELHAADRGSLPVEDDDIPTDKNNLIHQALALIRATAEADGDESSCKSGIDVEVEKTIPSAAGLGGASSNAAAALIAGNHVWGLKWSKPKLVGLAAQLGSDVPFFLTGGTAICRGRGEKIELIDAPAGLAVVIAKPPAALSTAHVFSNVTISRELHCSDRLVQSVRRGNRRSMGLFLFNRLQSFAEPMTSQIKNLRQEFQRLNCLGHQMSGSGSSYFGLFSNHRVARQAASCLSARLPRVKIFCSRTPAPFNFDS